MKTVLPRIRVQLQHRVARSTCTGRSGRVGLGSRRSSSSASFRFIGSGFDALVQEIWTNDRDIMETHRTALAPGGRATAVVEAPVFKEGEAGRLMSDCKVQAEQGQSGMPEGETEMS